jgi:peptidoglycan/LPS O-acetylase OafA/YrhL
VVEILKGYPQQLILNANFAVDTFFLLSGLVITSSLLREAERQKNLWPLAFSYLRRIFRFVISCLIARSNSKKKIQFLNYLIPRLCRLVPLYGVLLLIYMFVIAYIADGPFPVKKSGSSEISLLFGKQNHR